MSPLFKKLNLGTHEAIVVLGAPASFEAELASLGAGVRVARKVSGACRFALAFVVTRADLDAACAALLPACVDDAVLWMAYPKGSSKQYRSELSRDSGWPPLGAAGYEPVRMVAIDADWSALRFRRAEHIRTMTRDPAGAISGAGRKKAAARER